MTILKWAAAALAVTLVACGGAPEETARAQATAGSTASNEDSAVSSANHEGEIAGSVGEMQGAWNTLTLDMGGETRSTATFSNPVGLMTDFTLQGHEGGRFQIKDSVSVTFSLQGDAVVAGGVLYMPENQMFPHYGDHEDSVTVTLEELRVEGEKAFVKGRASGEIYRLADYTAKPDMSDSLSVDLAFDAVAYKK